jgi:sec-independent protein translocase protein TatA
MSPGRDGFGAFDAMGGLSIWHLIFAAVVILLLFGGRGKISGIMGDTAKGIRAFREGLKGEEEAHEEEPPAKPLPKTAAKSTASTRAKTKA